MSNESQNFSSTSVFDNSILLESPPHNISSESPKRKRDENAMEISITPESKKVSTQKESQKNFENLDEKNTLYSSNDIINLEIQKYIQNIVERVDVSMSIQEIHAILFETPEILESFVKFGFWEIVSSLEDGQVLQPLIRLFLYKIMRQCCQIKSVSSDLLENSIVLYDLVDSLVFEDVFIKREVISLLTLLVTSVHGAVDIIGASFESLRDDGDTEVFVKDGKWDILLMILEDESNLDFALKTLILEFISSLLAESSDDEMKLQAMHLEFVVLVDVLKTLPFSACLELDVAVETFYKTWPLYNQQ